MIGKASLSLQRWMRNIHLNDSFFNQALVWVSLPKVLMDFWYEDFFKGIIDSFRELLYIDLIKTSKTRLTYVRICCKVEKGKDIPKVVEIQSRLG